MLTVLGDIKRVKNYVVFSICVKSFADVYLHKETVMNELIVFACTGT